VIAAIAFSEADRIAGAWSLFGRGQTVKAIATDSQGPAALKTENLIRLSTAGRNHHMLSGLILAPWNLDAPVGAPRRKHRFKGVELIGSIGREGH